MESRTPLSDGIITAAAKLIDDSQLDIKREPSHSDIQFQIDRSGLSAADPSRNGGAPVGKAKRVRSVLSWALSNDQRSGEKFLAGLISIVQGSGGFRKSSPNYCGEEAIANLASAFSLEGWELGLDGTLRPKLLDALSGKEMTNALHSYADRARRGALDSPLLAGTAKDFLEATAAHVLMQKYGQAPSISNFPTLLGQAFLALGFATPTDPVLPGEKVNKRVERSAYELACALNALRNKEGTGHGRPWVSSITDSQARFSIESMGSIALLMLEAL